jgi:hypothetical protein
VKQKDISCVVGPSFRTKREALEHGKPKQCHRGRHWHAEGLTRADLSKESHVAQAVHDWQEESPGRWRCERCKKKRKSPEKPRPGVCRLA